IALELRRANRLDDRLLGVAPLERRLGAAVGEGRDELWPPRVAEVVDAHAERRAVRRGVAREVRVRAVAPDVRTGTAGRRRVPDQLEAVRGRTCRLRSPARRRRRAQHEAGGKAERGNGTAATHGSTPLVQLWS